MQAAMTDNTPLSEACLKTIKEIQTALSTGELKSSAPAAKPRPPTNNWVDPKTAIFVFMIVFLGVVGGFVYYVNDNAPAPGKKKKPMSKKKMEKKRQQEQRAKQM